MRGNVMCWVLGFAAAAAGEVKCAPRYVGRTADGKWIQGERLSDWHQTDARPQLDGRLLFSPDAPIRWLLDQIASLVDVPDAFVETIGGDRLPGVVVGHSRGDEMPFRQQPAHLIVGTAQDSGLPPALRTTTLRVVLRHVQRIVWHRRRSDRLRPRTLFLRDGGQIEFRAVRLDEDSVTLLLDGGTRRISFAEIAELHFKASDTWDAYFDELAILSPEGESRLLQISTVGGLVATASLARFEARVRGDSADSDRWLHGLQPAWSLDMIWVRHSDIRLRRTFAAHEIPLTRTRPKSSAGLDTVRRSGWAWRRNRSVLEGPLRFGGHSFGWGFGVHAPHELRFSLPASAAFLEAWVGLDQVVGPGGCARGRIVLEPSQGQPLFESPLLVGSGSAAATGRIALPAERRSPREIVFIADPAHEPRPPGTDPWAVRDFLDWGDPLVVLQPDRLQQRVRRSFPDQIAAFRGWRVHSGDTSLRGVNVPSNIADVRGGFDYAVATSGSPLELARQITLKPDDRWLVVNAAATESSGGAAKLEVSIDGSHIAEAAMPVLASSSADAELVAFELAPSLRGRAHKITLRQTTFSHSTPVLWQGIGISPQHPSLFRVLEDELPEGIPASNRGDAFSGERSLRLAGGEQIELPVSPGPVNIRETPQPGEYRFIRFAFHKRGPGMLRIELHGAGQNDESFVYTAGPTLHTEAGARSVWSEVLPHRWIVVTRDLCGDFAASELRGVTIHNTGTGMALFDHLYFARRQSDFDLAKPQ